ncbi:MAG TPA: glycogen synthase [Mycobacteriales bacterium]|nr:glycogen synthase [Mycobacteriales bacterium]
MRVGLLSREYPPDVYGGAGVHVEYLARELARRAEVTVHCFGRARTDPLAHAYPSWDALDDANSTLRVLSTDLLIAADVAGVDVVHSHTWYANLAGHLAKLLYGTPHVMTSHSLEPLRPWKAEQLGGGYAVSCWAERVAVEAADAVVAVSKGMRHDVLTTYSRVDPARVHVIHNGIDTEEFRPVDGADALRRRGLDPDRPVVLFVGRMARQKGIRHLLHAARAFDRDAQLLLCASSPDTPEIRSDVAEAVAQLQRDGHSVVWLEEITPRDELLAFLSAATVFVCPSVYEPMGIVNLEAMACETAVVASAVGGIPEVVSDGETGLLVPYDATSPASFERGLADAVNALTRDTARADAMGRAGRRRAVGEFSWPTVAEQTLALYHSLR